MARELRYFIPILILPAILFVSLYVGGYWSFFAGVFAFGLLPFLELFLSGTEENLSDEEEANERKKRIYDIFIYSLIPVQFIALGYFLWKIGHVPMQWYEILGTIWAMSIGCGVIGINVAHELGHRNKKYEQHMSKALLLTSLYMHFYIEHNRGHHKNIATRFDPATSRLNEPLYTFFIRTVRDSWVSAWKLETHRLKKINVSFWSWQNEMLRFQIIQITFCALIAFVFGWKALLAFFAAAILGFLLLETVNYIEHYGLERKEISEGRFEKVKPHHSWNSNHTLGRLLLFELTRHSDHHYNSGRKYQILRHFDNSPQMPTGYPGMMICAVIPPLWFKVMNPLVQKHKTELNEDYGFKLDVPAEVV